MDSEDFFADRESVAPPVAESLDVKPCEPTDHAEPPADAAAPLQPIAGLTCVIEYDGDERLISCRRLKSRGEHFYVGAVCLSASGYREFRVDRVEGVYDAQTGEHLGSGEYFLRFSLDERIEQAPTWGLTRSRKATLVAGLNVLAFMAHCDGRWHPLETEPVERFVCSLWLRREWEGEPPLAEIVEHAQRLSPNSDIFFRSVDNYARSSTRSEILRRAVRDLIAADGVICDEEFNWGQQFSDYLSAAMRRHGA